MKLEEWKKIIRVLKIMKMNERKSKMFDKGIRKINTPIGEFCIISSESGITKVTSENYIENNLTGKKHLDKAEEWIFSYFNGIEIERPCLDYRRMTVFQKKVLSELVENISFGETISYGELAILIENKGSMRAIGTALAKNPWPIIIPCHRVVKKDKTIGKYSVKGGEESKKLLLRHEGTKIFNGKLLINNP